MGRSLWFALFVLISPTAAFLLSKSLSPIAKFATKNGLSLASGVCNGRQNSRFQLAMSGRVPFIAGNWKMNPETVEQVVRE